jgi:hypothetical protein
MNYVDHVLSTNKQVWTTFTVPAGVRPTTQSFVSPMSVQHVAKHIRRTTTTRITRHRTTTKEKLYQSKITRMNKHAPRATTLRTGIAWQGGSNSGQSSLNGRFGEIIDSLRYAIFTAATWIVRTGMCAAGEPRMSISSFLRNDELRRSYFPQISKSGQHLPFPQACVPLPNHL